MRRGVGRKDSEHSERDGARATASPQPPSEPRGNCEKADNIQQETGYVDSDVEWDRMIRVRQRTVRRLQLERAASLRSSRGTEPAGRPAPPTFIRPRPPSRATLSHPSPPGPRLFSSSTPFLPAMVEDKYIGLALAICASCAIGCGRRLSRFRCVARRRWPRTLQADP
jgi:hypothetical protein